MDARDQFRECLAINELERLAPSKGVGLLGEGARRYEDRALGFVRDPHP
jgi:hypothetical protein